MPKEKPSSFTPDFLKSTKTFLRSAESQASKTPISEPKIKNPSNLETDFKHPQFYRPSKTAKISLKKRKKSTLPSILILSIIVAFIGFFSVFSNLGFRLEEAINRATDHQYTFNRLVSRHVIKQVLSGKHKMSERFASRLKKRHILVGTLDSSGNFIEDISFNNKKPRVFKFEDNIIDSKHFNLNYNSNPKFRDAYISARHGRAAAFFDNPANFLFKKLGLNRNVFSNYHQTNDNKTNQDSYRRTLSERFSNNANAEINTTKNQTRTDEKGNLITEQVTNGDNVRSQSITGATSINKAHNFLSGVSDKVNTANIGCALLQVGNLVAVAVVANNTYNSINYFMNNIENASKTRSGEGNHAALNPFLNFISTSTTEKVLDSSTNQDVSITGSPLESEGLRSALDPNYTPNQTLTKNFSHESTMSSILLALTTNGISTTGCSYLRGGGAALSLTLLAVPGGGFIRTISGFFIKTAASSALQIGAGTILAFLIPKIAESMFTNFPDNIAGIPAGEALMSGGAATHEMLGRSSSALMPASKDRILAFNRETSIALAQDSQTERLHKSPLDASSSNTFIGTLVNKLAPISNSSSLLSLSFLSRFLSSLNTYLSPLSFADGENHNFTSSFGKCASLNSIGADGDIYCNPKSIGDLSVTEIDIDNPTFRSVIEPNLEIDSSGRETIKNNSELGNFIKFCTERNSPFGVYDANIANAFEFSLGTIGDNLPVIEDVVDIANSVKSGETEAWATGANCINSPHNPRWDKEMKYYQLYIEYNRIFDQNGDFEDSKNPVLGFKNDYYQKNPLDNSDAGYLARISGLTKSEAAEVIALKNDLESIKNYHPESRFLFAHDNTNSIIKNSYSPHHSILSFNFNFSPQSYLNSYLKNLKPLAFFASSRKVIYNNLRNRTKII